MSPIIDAYNQRTCYVCGRPMLAWATVNIPSVPNAEICSDCIYKLADFVGKKEEELSKDGKGRGCDTGFPSDA